MTTSSTVINFHDGITVDSSLTVRLATHTINLGQQNFICRSFKIIALAQQIIIGDGTDVTNLTLPDGVKVVTLGTTFGSELLDFPQSVIAVVASDLALCKLNGEMGCAIRQQVEAAKARVAQLNSNVAKLETAREDLLQALYKNGPPRLVTLENLKGVIRYLYTVKGEGVPYTEDAI